MDAAMRRRCIMTDATMTIDPSTHTGKMRGEVMRKFMTVSTVSALLRL